MKIGKLELTPGFLLLAAWLNYMDRQGLFWKWVISCALHEWGHLWALWLLEIPVKCIYLTVSGAEIKVRGGMSYRGELLAALMGPAANLGAALVLCRIPGGDALAGINLVLACFNLLPIAALDGGRVLRCILSLTIGPDRGERAAAWVSRLGVVMLCGVGAAALGMAGNVTLLLASAWLLKEKGDKRAKRGGKSAKYHLQRDR